MRVIKVKKNARSPSGSLKHSVTGELDQPELNGIEIKELEFPDTKGSAGNSASDKYLDNSSATIAPMFDGEVADVEIRSRRPRNRKQGSLADGDHQKIGESGGTALKIEKGSFQDIYNRGVYLLSMREHGEQELATKLKQKFNGSSFIEEVISKLVEAGYLSDQRFAESYVRMRQLRGFGPIKIRSELSSKGIKNNTMEGFIDLKSSVWLELAELAYSKKYGDEPVLDYQAWVKRARFMQSRGYTREHIDAVVPSVNFND